MKKTSYSWFWFTGICIVIAFAIIVGVSNSNPEQEAVRKASAEKICSLLATAKKGDFLIIPCQGVTNVVVVAMDPCNSPTCYVESLTVRTPGGYPKGIKLYYSIGHDGSLGMVYGSGLPADTFVVHKNDGSNLSEWDFWSREFVKRIVE